MIVALWSLDRMVNIPDVLNWRVTESAGNVVAERMPGTNSATLNMRVAGA